MITDDIRSELAAYYQGNYQTRQAVLDHLDLSQDSIVPLLLAALNDDDPLVRAGTVLLIASLRSMAVIESETVQRAVAQALIEHLDDRDARVAIVATQTLAHFNDPKIAPALAANLHHPTRSLRKAAAEVLGALRAEAFVEDIIRAMQDDPLPRSFVSALAQIGSDPAIPILVETLGFDDYDCQNYAREGLIAMGQPAVAQVYDALVTTGDYVVMGLTAEILAEIGTPDAISMLEAAAKHDNPDVRDQAKRTLHHMGEL